MAEKAAPQQQRAAQPTPAHGGISPRVAVVGIVLLALIVLWIRQVELITFTCQITESVPPIPALAVLILFAVLRPLLRRRLRRLELSRQELAVLFVFISVGCVMSAVGVTQAFLPYPVVPFYFADPQNNYELMQQYLPTWFGPRGDEVIRTFFEGSETGAAPYGAWAGPLALWLLFFVAYWVAALCIWSILRAQWAERERLAFAITSIPLAMTETEPTWGRRPFLSNPYTWIGFGLVALFHGFNILHGFNPAVAAPGNRYWIGQIFTERPLDALRNVNIWYRPELIGLGYLMSLETLFSVWFFYGLENLAAVIGRAVGYEQAGFPFPTEQGMGGHIAMAIFLLYIAREHLRRVWRKALYNDPAVDDSREPLPYRAAVLGLVLSIAAILAFCRIAGMALWVAAMFFAMLFAALISYGRIRAETGTPSVWALPHSVGRTFLFSLFGVWPFKVGGSWRTMSVWTTFFWLVHGGFYNQATVYQLESFKLADEVGLRRQTMVYVCLSAVVVGLLFAFVMFLQTYYHYGTNVLAGGPNTVMGGVRITYCRQAWDQTSSYIDAPVGPDIPRSVAAGVGFGMAALLVMVRGLMLRTSLSPLGFVMAATVGHQLWFAFFVAWLAKSLIIRFGGAPAYRRLVPFFLGMAIGQFFLAGVVWGVIKAIWPHVGEIIWFT